MQMTPLLVQVNDNSEQLQDNTGEGSDKLNDNNHFDFL